MFLCSFSPSLQSDLKMMGDSRFEQSQSSGQTKEREERERGGALITEGIEEKRAGPYQVKMPYTFGDEDGWFPEGGERWG